MKICKDCKWFGRAWFVRNRLQYCNNPKIKEEKGDPVDGYIFADLARNYGPCYKEAKYWEPR